MASPYSGYINARYKPKPSDIITEFYLEKGLAKSFSEAAQAVAAESSIGTWTELTTMRPEIRARLSPKIFFLNQKKGICRIAYPLALFEKGNIPQLLSSVGGNVFGMKEVNALRLEDISLPKEFIRSFKGPRFGIQGIRKRMKVAKRPFVGTIIKPKLGLNAEQHSKVAFEAWLGGCDIVKDDENLSSMVFNNFDKRVRLSLKAAEKAERITGERKGYLANVTAESKEMLRRARLVEKLGGRYIMVDILSVGWSALQTLRNENLDLILHAHRAGHAALTRNKRHGISMLTIAKLCRLAGLDQLHIGAVFGKMEGGKKEVAAIDQEIEKGIVKPNSRQHVLAENWCGVKPMLAVCSGGLEPSKIPLLVRALGNDIVIQLGGGIHGHLSGTLAGAKAARQALEATMSGIPLRDYAKKHSELATALKTWQN